MRYIGLKEFMAMPPGTIYAIEQNSAQPLYSPPNKFEIKGENNDAVDFDWWASGPIEIDWNDTGELIDRLDLAMRDGANIPLTPEVCETRHGLYPKEGDIMFWVLDEDDHQVLINRLTQALTRRKSMHGNQDDNDL